MPPKDAGCDFGAVIEERLRSLEKLLLQNTESFRKHIELQQSVNKDLHEKINRYDREVNDKLGTIELSNSKELGKLRLLLTEKVDALDKIIAKNKIWISLASSLLTALLTAIISILK